MADVAAVLSRLEAFWDERMKMARKETKAERVARQERMRTAPALQRAPAEEFHRRKAAREQARRESESQA